jgi:outer membrane protein OmpA-like peptidoglycan-associated protein
MSGSTDQDSRERPLPESGGDAGREERGIDAREAPAVLASTRAPRGKGKPRKPRPTFEDGALTRVFKFPSKTYPRSSYYVTSTEVIIRIRKAKKRWKLVIPKKRIVSYKTNRWFAKPRWVEIELTYTQAVRLGLTEARSKVAAGEPDGTGAVVAPLPDPLAAGDSLDLEELNEAYAGHEADEGAGGDADPDIRLVDEGQSDLDDDQADARDEEEARQDEEREALEAGVIAADEADVASTAAAALERLQAEAPPAGEAANPAETTEQASGTDAPDGAEAGAADPSREPVKDEKEPVASAPALPEMASASEPISVHVANDIVTANEDGAPNQTPRASEECCPTGIEAGPEGTPTVSGREVTAARTSAAVALSNEREAEESSPPEFLAPARPQREEEKIEAVAGLSAVEPEDTKTRRASSRFGIWVSVLLAFVGAGGAWQSHWREPSVMVAEGQETRPVETAEAPAIPIETGSIVRREPEAQAELAPPLEVAIETAAPALALPLAPPAVTPAPREVRPEPVHPQTQLQPQPRPLETDRTAALVVPGPAAPMPQVELPSPIVTPTPARPAPSARAAACMKLDAAARTLRVRFDYASAIPEPGDLEALSAIVQGLPACSTGMLVIEGHTDSDGDAERNQTLSVRRAQAVRDYLVKAGTNPERLSVVGFGHARPELPNVSPENKQRNRRVTLVLEAPL